MKEILDIVVWVGIIYILFVFLRGLNEQQIKKHDDAIKKSQTQTQSQGNDTDDKTTTS